MDGSGSQGKIAPGEFMDFPLSVQVPDKAGTTLTFKALQTYDNGKCALDRPGRLRRAVAAGEDHSGRRHVGHGPCEHQERQR